MNRYEVCKFRKQSLATFDEEYGEENCYVCDLKIEEDLKGCANYATTECLCDEENCKFDEAKELRVVSNE